LEKLGFLGPGFFLLPWAMAVAMAMAMAMAVAVLEASLFADSFLID
jgi:hypothetical protein